MALQKITVNIKMKQITLILGFLFCFATAAWGADSRFNVLFIISDDLTATALSCYGNTVSQTPNIDRLANQGTRFTRALCQGTYCGPSRASFMSGYYPHATGVLGYTNPRPEIGDRATWSQHFKNSGYYAARVSKIYHMGVPGGIEERGDGRDHNSGDGADDPASWTEKFNSPGPEWKAPGVGETLEGNPDGKKPVVGGNTFVVVAADGDDNIHSDGKTSAKAVELIRHHSANPFFLAVGFVRPHVPFVSPQSYHMPYPFDQMTLPEKLTGDWDDIPKSGINYKTSLNMQMNEERQKKAVAGYYAAVAFMDAQVGKVPGKQPAVCRSLVELLDLYPTISSLCGLEIPSRLQGKDISSMFDNPTATVRDCAFCVAPSSKGFLLREDRWAFIQYAEDGSKGIELFDMVNDPFQYTNLASKPETADIVQRFQAKLAAKLKAVRDNDLER
ncbi:MAG: sulfatase-like hydrolase/transferase [Pirellulaceae bacterium]|nr:sulfatase-like hydrolase/transferase [Pirellulaceae bacterium]